MIYFEIKILKGSRDVHFQSYDGKSTPAAVVAPKLNYYLASQYQNKKPQQNIRKSALNNDNQYMMSSELYDDMLKETKRCIEIMYTDDASTWSERCLQFFASNQNDLSNTVKRHRPSSKYWFSRAG